MSQKTTSRIFREPDAAELRRFWETRPVRSGSDALGAGVCAGIARRYEVDPILIRAAILVAAVFGGGGILAYIAAWIVLSHDKMPRREDSVPRKRGGAAAVVVFIFAVVITPHTSWGISVLIGIILLIVGLWALYCRRPDPAPGTSANSLDGLATPHIADDQFTRWMPSAWANTIVTATTASTVDLSKRPTDPVADDAAPPITHLNNELPATPPAWDPLGAAPFAWDLPEPSRSPEPTPRPKRHWGLTLAVLGLAIVAAAVGTLLNVIFDVNALSPLRIASMVLIIVAGGLIVGALSGRGPGLLPVAVILAALIIAIAGVRHLPSVAVNGGIGDRSWAPITETDIAPSYELTAGTAQLDLRTVTLTNDRTVRVRVGVGEVQLVLNKTMNVDIRCHTGVGESHCANGVDGGTDGTRGPVLTVDATATVGEIEVNRD